MRDTKRARHKQTLKEITGRTDRLGMPIDKNIKSLVVALILNGFITYQSCEGHTDHSMGAPWVDIAAPNRPDEKFVKQNYIINQTARKLGIKQEIEDVRKTNIDLFCTVIDIAQEKYSINPETKKHKKWRAETKLLEIKLNRLLEEFYKNKSHIAKIVRLKILTFSDADFRLFNGGMGWMQDDFKLTSMFTLEEKIGHDSRLKIYQHEMSGFAKFLMFKYYHSTT
ncbi:MAG: hypothetical protein AAB824_01945 [Patescibacteria group bacterium]